MFIVPILIVLILVGLALYILSLLPIDATLKQIGKAVIIVVFVIWLIYQLLPLAHLSTR